MKKILIFKTDRVGDLINITPVINNLNLNNPDCKIDLICSSYNFQIAKHIIGINNIFIYENSILKFLRVNLKNILSTKYDLIFQLDGKTHSYFLATIHKSIKKFSLKFIKKKKIFGRYFQISRPNFLYEYFINTIECVENYNLSNNKSYHYLTLYFKLLKKAGFNIINKEHVLDYKPEMRIVKFDNEYIHFHIDEKWLNFNRNIHDKIIEFIRSISLSQNIAISSNLGENILFDRINNEFSNNKNILFLKSPDFLNLISIIYHSKTCISSHSGFIVHLAACYNKNIIDIVDQSIFNELDRWIPLNAIYKRYSLDDIEKINLD